MPEFYLPPKEDVYNTMEGLIWHFKIVMGETDVPKGEVYHCVEGGNGELGFYLVSDGGRTSLPTCISVDPVLFFIRLMPK